MNKKMGVCIKAPEKKITQKFQIETHQNPPWPADRNGDKR